jgi:peptide methionine sulfoxide reductase MsrB
MNPYNMCSCSRRHGFHHETKIEFGCGWQIDRNLKVEKKNIKTFNPESHINRSDVFCAQVNLNEHHAALNSFNRIYALNKCFKSTTRHVAERIQKFSPFPRV